MRIKRIRTPYWIPGSDYAAIVVKRIRHTLREGEVVVISEKAIATARGQIIDEEKLTPSLTAKIIARVWMPFVWGYLLGPVCRFKAPTIHRLRRYPSKEGAAHKQVAISYVGFLNALKYGSEGGIDLSNLPFSYASLPLKDSEAVAELIRSRVEEATNKKIVVMIADTDSTFSLRGVHFTSRPNPLKGIHYFPGPLLFILGRALGLKQRATPLAMTRSGLSIERALDVAEKAHHSRGYGSGRTVWDMMEGLDRGVNEITWKTLSESRHYPVVLARLT